MQASIMRVVRDTDSHGQGILIPMKCTMVRVCLVRTGGYWEAMESVGMDTLMQWKPSANETKSKGSQSVVKQLYKAAVSLFLFLLFNNKSFGFFFYSLTSTH